MTLRAIGWPRSSVAQVVAIQALTLGIGGGAIAAGLVAGGGLAIGAPVLITVASPLLALIVAVSTATVAMTGITSLVYRLLPGAALQSGVGDQDQLGTLSHWLFSRETSDGWRKR